MEGKLLYLQHIGPSGPGNRSSWNTVNGTGVPISQAQIPQAPSPLFTTDSDRLHLLNYLTTVLVRYAEPGWSPWQLHHIGEIKNGVSSGGQYALMVSVIVVRHRVVEGVQSSEALEKA